MLYWRMPGDQLIGSKERGTGIRRERKTMEEREKMEIRGIYRRLPASNATRKDITQDPARPKQRKEKAREEMKEMGQQHIWYPVMQETSAIISTSTVGAPTMHSEIVDTSLKILPRYQEFGQNQQNRKVIYAKGVGTVRFGCVQLDGTIRDVQIRNVYWFPEADCNLLSQGRLMETSAKFNFDKEFNLTFEDKQGIIGLMARYNKTVKMWKVQVVMDEPRMNVAVGADNWQLWHQRLGHRAMSALKATGNLVDGMTLQGKEPKGCFCIGCQLGKGHRDPFPSTGHKAEKPLEKIHMDLFGPIVDVSVRGNKYGLVVTDDMSSAKFFYGLNRKTRLNVEIW